MARKTNIEVNGHNYYRVTKVIGHKADGTAIRKSFYGAGINEANEKANQYMNDIKSGMSLDYKVVTLHDLMKAWLFDVKLNELKPSSFQSYEGIFRNYIVPSPIAGQLVSEIKSIQIQKFYNNLGKEKSYSVIKKINKLLKSFFIYAEAEGYIVKNPCNKLTIPNKIAKAETEIEYFSEEEIQTLKETLKGHPLENLILLDFATGLRQGELLALKWENIDLVNKRVNIKETIKKVYIFDSDGNKRQETVTSSPKTKNSIRIVDLPDNVVKMLKDMPRKSEYVFCNSNGLPFDSKYIFRNWQKIMKETKLPYRKFHSIRHTYASMLLLNGVDLKTVQDLMGHSDIAITQIYLHVLPKSKISAVNKLNYLF